MARDVHPDSLFEKIKRSGGTIEQTYPGVYYLSGIFNTPSQILVTSELDPELYASLRILTKRAKEEDVENFLRMTQGFTEPGDRQNADAVLQLSVSANRSVYEEIKRIGPVAQRQLGKFWARTKLIRQKANIEACRGGVLLCAKR
jgi:hypothetical protein